jgi:thiamine transporter ThiT
MFVDLLITVAVIFGVAWLLRLLPFGDPYKQIIQVIAIVAVVVVLLQFVFGLNVGAHFGKRWG